MKPTEDIRMTRNGKSENIENIGQPNYTAENNHFSAYQTSADTSVLTSQFLGVISVLLFVIH